MLHLRWRVTIVTQYNYVQMNMESLFGALFSNTYMNIHVMDSIIQNTWFSGVPIPSSCAILRPVLEDMIG
jgi:hypothetical protein